MTKQMFLIRTIAFLQRLQHEEIKLPIRKVIGQIDQIK